jgi:GNAT superfamily N-acetyltransferase
MRHLSATKFVLAAVGDAEPIAHLRNAAAAGLTARHGRGWWSRECTAKSVVSELRISEVYLLRARGSIVATFRLATKKPWVIDAAYFTRAKRVRYLQSLAVLPMNQGSGIGTKCLEAAVRFARSRGAEAIRLDAFDHAAGAGEFYRKNKFCEVGHVSYRGVPLIYFERLLPPLATGSSPLTPHT